MANLSIPTRNLESLRPQEVKFVWPEGAYRGTLESVERKDLPSTAAGEPFKGYLSAGNEGERLAIKLGDITPLESQGDVGARKWFVDLVIKDGTFTYGDYDVLPKDAWQLKRSAEVIANLANALDQGTVDGNNFVMNDGFVEALANGDFDNTEIVFVVAHSKKKDKDGNPYQEIDTFVRP